MQLALLFEVLDYTAQRKQRGIVYKGAVDCKIEIEIVEDICVMRFYFSSKYIGNQLNVPVR